MREKLQPQASLAIKMFTAGYRLQVEGVHNYPPMAPCWGVLDSEACRLRVLVRLRGGGAGFLRIARAEQCVRNATSCFSRGNSDGSCTR